MDAFLASELLSSASVITTGPVMSHSECQDSDSVTVQAEGREGSWS